MNSASDYETSYSCFVLRFSSFETLDKAEVLKLDALLWLGTLVELINNAKVETGKIVVQHSTVVYMILTFRRTAMLVGLP